MADKTKMDSAGSSITSTRQLLDELDALMQRMLALPVGDTEAQPESDQAATTVAEPPAELPPEPESASESPAAEPVATPAPVATEKSSPASYQYDEMESEQSSESPAQEVSAPAPALDSPAPTEAPAPEEIAPKLRPVNKEVLASLAARPGRLQTELLAQQASRLESLAERPRWWLWPLSLPSRLFDLTTYLLGPLGRWLRSSGGHTFLGLLGILLILAAVALHLFAWLTWN
jgi:hypothetical protein